MPLKGPLIPTLEEIQFIMNGARVNVRAFLLQKRVLIPEEGPGGLGSLISNLRKSNKLKYEEINAFFLSQKGNPHLPSLLISSITPKQPC